MAEQKMRAEREELPEEEKNDENRCQKRERRMKRFAN